MFLLRNTKKDKRNNRFISLTIILHVHHIDILRSYTKQEAPHGHNCAPDATIWNGTPADNDRPKKDKRGGGC